MKIAECTCSAISTPDRTSTTVLGTLHLRTENVREPPCRKISRAICEQRPRHRNVDRYWTMWGMCYAWQCGKIPGALISKGSQSSIENLQPALDYPLSYISCQIGDRTSTVPSATICALILHGGDNNIVQEALKNLLPQELRKSRFRIDALSITACWKALALSLWL